MTEDSDSWVYFAKGKANVVFKNKHQSKFLLRLRKKTETKSWSQDTLTVFRFYNQVVRPKLGHFLLDLQIIELSPYFLKSLNAKMSKDCKIDENESYGLLIPNCLFDQFVQFGTNKFVKLYKDVHNADELVVEIKPKWLYSNLSSRYCRNCASLIFKKQPRHFCPMGLISNDETVVAQTVNKMVDSLEINESHNIDGDELKRVLAVYFGCTDNKMNVMRLLESLQNINDNKDSISKLGNELDVTDDLLLGMAMRDVTVFVKITTLDRSALEAMETLPISVSYPELKQCCDSDNEFIVHIHESYYKLRISVIDVDLKSKSKWEYWKQFEQALVKSGSYNQPGWEPCVV